MPKLSLFNTQLNVASDDFVISGLLEVLMRCFGLLVVLIEYLRFGVDLQCSEAHQIHSYLFGLIITFVVTILLDLAIVHISMRGTIIDDSPRRSIPSLLYARISVLMSEFSWTCIGTYVVLLHLSHCDSRVYWLACLAVLGGWLTTIIQGIFVLAFIDFKAHDHEPVITTHDWEKRWKNLFCCLNFEQNRHVFSTLSQLCVQLFKGKEMLVGSDILAGLKLLYEKQKHTRMKLDVVDAPLFTGRLRCRPHKTAMSPDMPRKDWMDFSLAAQYMKFALGSYGWFYYIGLNNPIVAVCRLMPELRYSYMAIPKQVEKDGKYLANVAAFRLQTGLNTDDIVFASFHNEIYAIPFFVSLDAQSKAVVVSVRGTLSLEDILTDLVVERAPVHYEGYDGLVHIGMLHSAKYIRNRLMTENLLDTAFQRAPGYRLVITGHSLGAGVAALLAMELRPLYRYLICFAFAPPGELISESLLPYTEEFICSVVLGYDVVPRLGLLEFANLRIDILKAIEHCKLPKHEVIASDFWTKIFGKHTEYTVNLDEPVSEQVMWFEKFVMEEIDERARIMNGYSPLYPPGQILHILERNVPKKPWNVPSEYYAEWVDKCTFSEIILSHRMIAHHFPDTLLYALRQIAEHQASNVDKTE